MSLPIPPRPSDSKPASVEEFKAPRLPAPVTALSTEETTEARREETPPRSVQEPSPVAQYEETVLSTGGSKSDGLSRCPKCGSTENTYSIEREEITCNFCHTRWKAEAVDAKLGLSEGLATLSGTLIGSGSGKVDAAATADVVTMRCGGCGAEVTLNLKASAKAKCHWCRQTLSLNAQIPNGAVPDAILPFKVTKEVAVQKISEFAGDRKFFALGKFKRDFKPENVLGVYLPYFIVDGNMTVQYEGVGEIETRRWTVRVPTGKDSNGNQTYREETHYAADVYEITRAMDLAVDDLTMEGSSTRARFANAENTNNIINAILPFDAKNAVAYDPGYLTGFSSERRDLNVETVQPALGNKFLSIGRARADAMVEAYDRGVRWTDEGLNVRGTRWVTLLCPVWLYSYAEFKDGADKPPFIHYIAVNGRTGETMGSIPIAKAKLLGMAGAIGLVGELGILAALAAGAR